MRLWLSEYFDQRNVSYTGSPKAILLYDSNKVVAKKQVLSQGIATANFFVTFPGEYTTENDLPMPFPLFVKPLDAANGNGVDIGSIVHNFRQFQDKVANLHDEFDELILVEKYLDGREFTVSLIEDHGNLIVSPIELIPPDEDGFRILGTKAKTENSEILKRISDPKILADVIDIAKRSFIALGARDFGRIDIKMDDHGRCHFIEANLVPGMTIGSSYFPRACEMNSSLGYDKVVRLMIQGAVARTDKRKNRRAADPVVYEKRVDPIPMS